LAVDVSFLGLNCQDCRHNKSLREFRGCEKETERIQYIMDDGTELHRCPASQLPSEMGFYINMYSQYKKGHLPFSKISLLRHPAKLIEIFDILESAEINAEKNRNKNIK